MEITKNILLSGLHESLSAKSSYVSPAVKVVAFKVEVGLNGSDPYAANVVESFTESTSGWAFEPYHQTGEQTVFGNN